MAMGNIDLSPQLIQAVRDAVDVVAVASEHTSLRKAGKRHEGLCPLHKEKTPSFSVDPDKGLFYCFGCGAGGDAIRLHMLTSGDDFPSAIEALAQRYGIPLPSRGANRQNRGPERDLHGALHAAEEFFRESLEKTDFPRQYLEKRQISKEQIEGFGLGYAPEGWEGLLKALSGRIPLADLEAAGLIGRSEKAEGKPYDRFRHRLIFPIRSPSGRLLGFGGRTLGDHKAKYINTRETEQFHKGRLLYGLHRAKKAMRETGLVVLTEGYFDVLATAACGFEAAVASMGTSLTQEQARLLSRYCDEVVVGYDGDKAGEAAFQRALPLLLAEGLKVRRAQLGEGEDPDSLRLSAGEGAVRQALEEGPDAILLAMEQLIPAAAIRDPKARSDAAGRVRDLLHPIPDTIVRSGYARMAAQRLGVPEGSLWKRGARPVEAPVIQEGGLTRQMEEWLLARLLRPDQSLPKPDQLPVPEVFFDELYCRIYTAFLEIYSVDGKAPSAESVRNRLPAGGLEMERLSRIEHDASESEIRFGTPELIAKLKERWKKQRGKELAARIQEAAQRGDTELMEQLISETQLARRVRD